MVPEHWLLGTPFHSRVFLLVAGGGEFVQLFPLSFGSFRFFEKKVNPFHLFGVSPAMHLFPGECTT
jgi:hypothetical protein